MGVRLIYQLFLMVLSNFLVFADQSLSTDGLLYSLGEKRYGISFHKNYGLISTVCLDNKRSCKAIDAYKSTIDPKTNLYGGARVGSVICRNQFKSKVVILRDDKKNENSFCEFDDGTLIEIGSLEKVGTQ